MKLRFKHEEKVNITKKKLRNLSCYLVKARSRTNFECKCESNKLRKLISYSMGAKSVSNIKKERF